MARPRNPKINLTITQPVDDWLRAGAAGNGVRIAAFASHVLELAMSEGWVTIPNSAYRECPFSAAALNELHWPKGRSLAQIGKLAADGEGWPAPPTNANVRRWLDDLGISYRREPVIIARTPRTIAVATPEGAKRCPVCREVKPVEDFYRDSSRPDGQSRTCKACFKQPDSAKFHSYYERNKERLKAKAAARRAAAKADL